MESDETRLLQLHINTTMRKFPHLRQTVDGAGSDVTASPPITALRRVFTWKSEEERNVQFITNLKEKEKS